MVKVKNLQFFVLGAVVIGAIFALFYSSTVFADNVTNVTNVTGTSAEGSIPNQNVNLDISGGSIFNSIFNSGIPGEIFSSKLVEFIVMFLLLFAIVLLALEIAKFPGSFQQGTNNADSKTKYIIAVAFGLLGAVGIVFLYPGLFPVYVLATKFVMLLVIIGLFYVLSALVFRSNFWDPQELTKTVSRMIVAATFFITIFTFLFLDNPVNMAIENVPICQNQTWNNYVCSDEYPSGCLAVDYSTGNIVCCKQAFSSSIGKIGKFSYCREAEPAKRYFLSSSYSPGVMKKDDALCAFDNKTMMPFVGHNMCATLGEALFGPTLYRSYKYYILQFLWVISGLLIAWAFYNRYHSKPYFGWIVAWLAGVILLLLLGVF